MFVLPGIWMTAELLITRREDRAAERCTHGRPRRFGRAIPRAIPWRNPGARSACYRSSRDAFVHRDRSGARRCALPRAGRRPSVRHDPRTPSATGNRHPPRGRCRDQDHGRSSARVVLAGDRRGRDGSFAFGSNQSRRGGSPLASARRHSQGPALAATLDGQLDYFGTTVRDAVNIVSQAHDGELLLTQAVAADPEVAGLLNERRITTEVVPTSLPGHRHLIRVRLDAIDTHS